MDRGAGEAEFHHPDLAVDGLVDGASGGLGGVDKLFGGFDQGGAGGGEFDAAGAADEQFSLEALLQFLDDPAQRRLGDAEPVGGAPEVEFLRYREEGPRLFNLHAKTPPTCMYTPN